MDFKERITNEAINYLKSKPNSQIRKYASGDINKNSDLLVNYFIDGFKKKKLNNMLFGGGLLSIDLAGLLFVSSIMNNKTLEGLCAIGLGASIAYALKEGLLLASPYFFTDEIREKTKDFLAFQKMNMLASRL